MAINLEKRNISFIYLHHRSLSMTTEEKDIYAIGEIPPLGYMPKKMHAWVICVRPFYLISRTIQNVHKEMIEFEMWLETQVGNVA